MEKREVLEMFRKFGAIIVDSHIIYTSGGHGSGYVNKDAIYPHTIENSKLCLEIAKHFSDDNIDVVVAPAGGGSIISQWVAFHLTNIINKEVLGIYAEKIGESFVIKRGNDRFVNGKNILIVDDVINTWGSVIKIIEAVRSINGNIVGLGVFCNRGGVNMQYTLGLPKFVSLIDMYMESYDANNCPMCAKKIPINTDFGKGKI